LTTAPLEDHNRVVYRKSDFLFGDAAPDTDQQLLAGEGQWIFSVEGEKYYLPSRRRHFILPICYGTVRDEIAVTRSTDSVHIGVLTRVVITVANLQESYLACTPGG